MADTASWPFEQFPTTSTSGSSCSNVPIRSRAGGSSSTTNTRIFECTSFIRSLLEGKESGCSRLLRLRRSLLEPKIAEHHRVSEAALGYSPTQYDDESES